MNPLESFSVDTDAPANLEKCIVCGAVATHSQAMCALEIRNGECAILDPPPCVDLCDEHRIAQHAPVFGRHETKEESAEVRRSWRDREPML